MTHPDIFKPMCDVYSAYNCGSVISSGELPSRLCTTENKQTEARIRAFSNTPHNPET
jgi:hypothetical protein